jgi:hypothetical protein
MSFASFVSSLFSTVYADAPAEEPKAEETPEASEEPAEEEEEPEPEDVRILLSPIFFWGVTWDPDQHGPFSCIPRFERSAKTAHSALRSRSTIYIARRRSTAARVSRERIVLRNCKLLLAYTLKLDAEIFLLQM